MTAVKSNPKRERIINAAVKLFLHTHDIKKVSLEDIAKEARVSPTTIYNNFGTRDNLLYEMIKLLVRDTLERNKAIVLSNIPFPQKLISIISGKVGLVSEVNREVVTKMISQDASIAPFIDEIYREEIRPLWRKILADGKREGYVDPSLSEDVLIIYLDVLKEGFKTNQEFLRGLVDDLSQLEQLTNIMFYGFLKKPINLFKKEAK